MIVPKTIALKIIIFIYSIFITIIGAVFLFKYSGDYDAYSESFFGYGGDRFEPGYRILSGIFSHTLGQNEFSLMALLITSSIFTLFIKFSVVARENKSAAIVCLFLIIYSSYFFLLHESNQVRASLGIAFGIWSIQKLIQGKTTVSIVILLISISFHYSMILFFIPFVFNFFLVQKKLKTALLLSCILISAIWATFNPVALGTINPLMIRYAEFNLEYRFNSAYLLLLALIIPFGLLNIKKMTRFGLILFLSYIFLFFLSLALMSTPIVAVRVMDIANIAAFFSIFSTRFSFDIKTLILYALPIIIALSRSYIFLTTDTILRLPN